MENIPSYINRKHGKEKITYMHSSLEDVLEETYGIFIYQEQVLRAAQILADAAATLGKDKNGIILRYLETMKEIASGDGKSTTFFPLPIDFLNKLTEKLADK